MSRGGKGLPVAMCSQTSKAPPQGPADTQSPTLLVHGLGVLRPVRLAPALLPGTSHPVQFPRPPPGWRQV